jgi:hypothetical protein
MQTVCKCFFSQGQNLTYFAGVTVTKKTEFNDIQFAREDLEDVVGDSVRRKADGQASIHLLTARRR